MMRGLDQDTPPLMIVPDSQVLDAMTALNAKIVPLRWAVRTHGDPKQLSAAIAEQLRQASGGLSGGAHPLHGGDCFEDDIATELQHDAAVRSSERLRWCWRRSGSMD